MENKYTQSYIKAKEEADNVDVLIRECIKNHQHFLVEAAAGSGKTYSLNSTVDWLEKEKPLGLDRDGRKIACITFTNIAVDVMRSRLPESSSVEPCTIHTFCWNLMQNFQEYLIKHVPDVIQSKRFDYSSVEIKRVLYDLGIRNYNPLDCSLSLYHEDVIKYFELMLDEKKFRRIIASIYPIILIDEYQDSDKRIISKFIKYFIDCDTRIRPIIGLFGDAWQCIYASLNGVGEIKCKNMQIINKNTNFRSYSSIVAMLNKIRSCQTQICSKEDEKEKGAVCLITCKEPELKRYQERFEKGDLEAGQLRTVIDDCSNKIESLTGVAPKILIITHKIIARSLGFESFLETYGTDIFRDKDDPFFLYCKNTIEPIFCALYKNDPPALADALGINKVIVRNKEDKKKWKLIYKSLKEAREGKLIDLIEYCSKNEYGLIPQDDNVLELLDLYKEDASFSYREKRIEDILNIPYHEFLVANEYIDEKTFFSTEHGSKGDEFENVIFVINKGWNQYQYHKYFPFNQTNNDPSFIRNRNLFYVSSSRAIKRLFFLLTYDGGQEFENYLKDLSNGASYDYKNFLSLTHI